MENQPTLTGPRLEPATGAAPEQVIILLHGVGADGNDLIGLAPYFQQVLPGALFLSPNAPFPYDMAPFGRQWFSLQDRSAPARLAGTRSTAPALDAYLDGVLADTGLNADRMVLIGFSQGAMMSLYVGLRRQHPLGGIIGYSGMLVGAELLEDEIKSRPRFFWSMAMRTPWCLSTPCKGQRRAWKKRALPSRPTSGPVWGTA